MTKTYTFTDKLPSLNEYVGANRKNKYAGAKMKKDIESSLCWQIAEQGLVELKPPLRISFKWFEKNRKRDKDNVVFGKKFILDSLQVMNVIGNDNWEWITSFEDTVFLSSECEIGSEYMVRVELQEVQ